MTITTGLCEFTILWFFLYLDKTRKMYYSFSWWGIFPLFPTIKERKNEEENLKMGKHNISVCWM